MKDCQDTSDFPQRAQNGASPCGKGGRWAPASRCAAVKLSSLLMNKLFPPTGPTCRGMWDWPPPGQSIPGYMSVDVHGTHKSWAPNIYFKNEDKLNKVVNLAPHTRKIIFWVNRGMCRKVTAYATGPKPDVKKDTFQSHTPWQVTDTSQEAVVPSSLLLPLIFLFLALPQQLWHPRSTVTAAEHTRQGRGRAGGGERGAALLS